MINYYQIEQQMKFNTFETNSRLTFKQRLDEAFNAHSEQGFDNESDRASKRRYVPGLGIDQNHSRRVVRLGRLMIAW